MLSVALKYQVNTNVDDNIVKEAELITKSKNTSILFNSS
jgi:hypothetical protein